MQGLLGIAEQDVNVVALIDRVNVDTILLDVPASHPEKNVTVVSRKKRIHLCRTLWQVCCTMPLALTPIVKLFWRWKGHGAGYLPNIHRKQLQAVVASGDSKVVLTVSNGGSIPLPAGGPICQRAGPILPAGCPILPAGGPILPAGGSILPANHMPISTFGLGKARGDE